MSRRLGLLGPIIVLVGALAAGVGVWWMVNARPKAMAFLDVFALDSEAAVAVRRSSDHERAFIELRHFRGTVAWQALVPPYAGHPGVPALAVSREAMSVRVVRNDHAEVFGMSMVNAAKLGGLKLAASRPPQPKGHTLDTIVTLTDQHFSFEVVGQQEAPAWASLVAIDLGTGRERWDLDLGAEPIRAGGVVDGAVWIQQGTTVRAFRTSDGALTPVEVTPPDPDAPVRVLLDDGAVRVEFDRGSRTVSLLERGAVVGRVPWPAAALEPWPYHLAGGRLWIVFPDRLRSTTLDDVRRSVLEMQ